MNVKLTSRYMGPCHNTILVSPKKLFFFLSYKNKKNREKRLKNKKYRKRQTTWLAKIGKKGICMHN